MAKSKFHWFVPEWGHEFATITPVSGLNNVGSDIVARLVDTDFQAPGDPRQDNFVVERIIGQYKLSAAATAPNFDRMIHHRVYVADSDQATVALRDLYTQDDADSSFLWTHIEGWASNFNGTNWGSWQVGSTAAPAPTFQMGRKGHFDIRVGRRIEEGQSLLWHTQLEPANEPALVDDTWGLLLYARILLREA